MGQLTDAMIKAIAGFRQERIDALTADLAAGEAVDAVSASGALSLTRRNTELTVSGTKAYTLAAPTYVNQRKTIRCVSAASTPAGTLTVSSPDDVAGFICPATFFFDVAGQDITLEATAALKWRCIKITRKGGAVDNVVVGTTAITNKMWRTYALSVTGTVESTLPNGSCVGEQIQVINTTAASTPIGSLAGTFKGALAAAYTHLGTFGVVASTTVVGDMALLEWDGSAWVVLWQAGTTLS